MNGDRLLQVKDLTVRFQGGEGPSQDAVRKISFNLNQGETLGIVGESGSGKSVSAMSIMRLLPYPAASHPTGKILFEGRDLLELPEPEMRALRGRRIGMVFQEPMTALNPLHTVEKQIAEVLRVHQNMSKEKARARVCELLHLVGLEQLTHRLKAYPHQLSGGQRQRVMMAMALANEPDLLIADEPTTALDVTVQAQMLQLLKDLQSRMNMALLLISHDLRMVERMADHVAVMHQGSIVEQGAVERIMHHPEHDYTRKLLGALTGERPESADRTRPEVMKGRGVQVHFPVGARWFGAARSWVHAVDQVDVTLRAGQTTGVVGESGSGKSTLGLALLRLIDGRGEVVFQGRDISAYNRKQMRPYRSRMQIVFQDPFGSLSPRLSVGQIVGEGLEVHCRKWSRAQREQAVIRALQEVGLDPETRHRYPHEFSGGQRQRIAIARALVLEPEILVLDEPTSALDVSVQAQIVALLKRLQAEKNLAYLFISHDMRVVRALAHEILVMKDGRAVEAGPASELLDRPAHEYTQALFRAAFEFEAAYSSA